MVHTAIVVLTFRNLQRILDEGGSQSWRLDPARARRTEYLVCTQNRQNYLSVEPAAPHRAAFLVGRISGVIRAPESLDRWLIQIQDYAPLPNIPDVWGGWRYPVCYTTLEELQIDPARLSFQPLPPRPRDDGGVPAKKRASDGARSGSASRATGFGQAMRALFEPLGGLEPPPPVRQPTPEPPDFSDGRPHGSSAAA